MLTRQHAAFQFEIFKAVAILGRFRQTHHRLAGERLLMAQVIPVVATRRTFQIGQIGFGAIAQVEEIAQHGDRIALFARAEQFAHRHVQRFAEQIQQRRFQRRHGIHPQFKCPGTFAKGIEIDRLVALVHALDHFIQPRHLLADHLRDGIHQGLVDHLAAGGFPDAGIPGVIGQHHDIAGKPGVMRAADVQQHAVLTGNRDNLHFGYNRARLHTHYERSATGFSSIRLISPTSTR
ncbi:hypothetical protein D3C76_1201950 [compost metagenome]